MKLLEASKIENIKCKPITVRTFSRHFSEGIFQKMIDFCKQNNGVGLAAPQIGIFERFFVAFVEGRWQIFVNPKITKREGEQESIESCLSYPGLTVKMKRAQSVILVNTIAGKVYVHKFSGHDANIIQHEYDHLDGITINNSKDKLEIIK